MPLRNSNNSGKQPIMILRFTRKLSQKLRINALQDCNYEVNPFEEWYGHLFTANRIQYILFTNAYSLYSIIVPGKGIITLRDFIDLTFSWLNEVLKVDKCEMIMQKFITPSTEIIDVCKTNNRVILGSMNDMINQSKFFLSEFNLSPLEVSKRLNETPYSYLKYNNPLSIIKQFVIKED